MSNRKNVPVGARGDPRRHYRDVEAGYDEDGMAIQPTATTRSQGRVSGARMEEDDGVIASPAPPSRQRREAKAARTSDDDSAAPLKAPNQRTTTQLSRRDADRNQATSRVGAISVAGVGAATTDATATRGGASASRVGAIRMTGIDVDNIPGEDDTVVIGGGYSSVVGSGETVVAEAVTSDDHIAQELRAQLRSEIQRELQAQIITATAISTPSTSMTPSTQPTTNVVPSSLQGNYKEREDDEEDHVRPFCTRNRVCIAALVAALVVIAAVAAVVVVLVILPSDNGGGSSSGGQDPNGEITVGGTQPSEPTPPGFPAPSPTPNLRPTMSALPPVSLMNRQRFEGSSGDNYGEHVRISRDSTTMVVGASSGDYVQVFQRNNGSWNRVGQTVTGDGQFGRCVDLNQDGRLFIAGAWNNNDADEKAGHAKVYRLSGNSWNQVGQTLTGDSSEDRFGWYVAMSDDGNTVAASARLADASAGTDSGLVRVYTFDGSRWNQLGRDLEGDGGGIQFGRSLALDSSGRRIAVGANLGGVVGGGRVRVFDWSGNSWNQVGESLDGDNPQDWQGTSVALSAGGVYLAVGTDGTDQNGSNSGSVKTFRFDGSTWVRYDDGMILGEAQNDQFSASQICLSNDGSCLAVGANHYNNDRGKGYLFRYDGTKWNKIAEADGDSSSRFGDSAAVSGDCQWVAWGAIGDSYVDVFQISNT